MTKESKLRQFDRAFGAPTLTIQHERIHRGEFFTASLQGAILSDASSDFLIRVAADTSAHMRFFGTVSQNMLGLLFEAPTTSADGSAVTCVDRNRFTKSTATTLIFAGPTVSDDGLNLMDFFIPGGQKVGAGGGEGSSFEEFVLSPGDYLMRVANTLVSPSADGHTGVVVDFYEPISGTDPS